MIYPTFDDVLIKPKFSFINSRKDVSTVSAGLDLPVISSNMDTITEVDMAVAMSEYGAAGCLHRFVTPEANVGMLKRVIEKTGKPPMVSVGIGAAEFERALMLAEAGAEQIIIDVANGAQFSVVEQYKKLTEQLRSNVGIIVGNFATADSINEFNSYVKSLPMGFKIGIGSGSACTTRTTTGIGMPTFASIVDCSNVKNTILIADGGIKTAGDVAKAIGAGAHMVMIGGMFAGTIETPGDVVYPEGEVVSPVKRYRGSASLESYMVQGKTDKHRAPEGEAFYVPLKGSVKEILQVIEGGLRSSMTYTNSFTIDQFQKNCEFITVSTNGTKENGAHGKK
jgi:IMP dehydrogenase